MPAITRVYRTDMPATPDALMAWHAAPSAFERLTPPWKQVTVIDAKGTIGEGDRKTIRVPVVGRAGFTWTLAHEPLQGSLGFADVQVSGPFRSWRHEHRFLSDGQGRSALEDRLTWELPTGGAIIGRRAEQEIDRLFRFRHERTQQDLARLGESSGERPLRIAVTGSRGLVGSRLVPFLRTGGHDVLRLVRKKSDRPDEVFWDPSSGTIDADALEGLDAVVHLAGASIAGGLWTRKRKVAIHDSRINGTHLLAKTLAELDQPPAVFVSASAVGIYGSRGPEVLTEHAAAGEGFLAGVVRDWEAAAEPATSAGIRVVHPRFGVVLAAEGGILPLISMPFRLGVGGPLGNGRQYFSWIAADDLTGVLFEAITNPSLAGPVNAVAPHDVTNADFTRALAHVLHRPAFFRLPASIMRRIGGQLAEEVILASQRVVPARLQNAGFQFAYPTLEQALRFEFGAYGAEDRMTSISSAEIRSARHVA